MTAGSGTYDYRQSEEQTPLRSCDLIYLQASEMVIPPRAWMSHDSMYEYMQTMVQMGVLTVNEMRLHMQQEIDRGNVGV